MRCFPNKPLPFHSWPERDRRLWHEAFNDCDLFDQKRAGANLSQITRQWCKSDYGSFLGFLAARHPEMLARMPSERLDREIAAEYVAYLRRTCRDTTVVIKLKHLRDVLTCICEEIDWSWVQTSVNRIAIKTRPQKHPLVTSERLYALGVQLMDRAAVEANAVGYSKRLGHLYRDGLLIALLAAIPLRRRTLANLRVAKQLVKAGELWVLDIPAEDTKTRRAIEYPIPANLCARMDVYLEQFRRHIRGADTHDGLWASSAGGPMWDVTIRKIITRRTRKAFGFSVSPHRFRHAAATFWSIRDPANVRGAKDLLAHASFRMTEKHYIKAQSRIAGRELARALAESMERRTHAHTRFTHRSPHCPDDT